MVQILGIGKRMVVNENLVEKSWRASKLNRFVTFDKNLLNLNK